MKTIFNFLFGLTLLVSSQNLIAQNDFYDSSSDSEIESVVENDKRKNVNKAIIEKIPYDNYYTYKDYQQKLEDEGKYFDLKQNKKEYRNHRDHHVVDALNYVFLDLLFEVTVAVIVNVALEMF